MQELAVTTAELALLVIGGLVTGLVGGFLIRGWLDERSRARRLRWLQESRAERARARASPRPARRSPARPTSPPPRRTPAAADAGAAAAAARPAPGGPQAEPAPGGADAKPAAGEPSSPHPHPAVAAERATAKRGRRRSTARPGAPEALPSSQTLLMVDDQLDLQAMHTAYLEQHGFLVLTASDGDEALTMVRRHHPAIIVLDHSLPKRTGIQVVRELKADPDTAGIPIILMTAHSYGAVGATAIAAGCVAYLPKPCDPSRVLKEVMRHVRAGAAS